MAFEHDRRYKRIFSNPYFMQKLLESFVQETFIKDLDFSTLNRIDKSFINEDFSEKESDLIYTVKFKEKTLYIFLLLEFQSTVDKLMPVRFLRYIMELYESFGKIPKGGKFPAVFPLLLYSGDAKWTAEEEISVLIEKTLPKGYIPAFKYYPVLENRIPKKSLIKIKNAVSAIFYIENSSPEDIENEIDILMDIIKGENIPVIKELVNWFNNYLFHLNSNINKESLSLKMETLTEVKAMFATKLKEYEEKILEQGIEKGIEQGEYLKAMETALNLKKLGVSVDIIIEATGLSKEKIEKLL